MRERYDRRRAEVVLGAARVFAERGYDQTSVPELAEALGLAAGSLYHYFPSKEELLRAICDQLMDPLLEQAEALLAEPREPAEQLRALVRLWVAHVVAHRDHMLVFQQERHVIAADLVIAGRTLRTEFTLADREPMRYPVLLGRRLLRKNFLVDVSIRRATDQVDEEE